MPSDGHTFKMSKKFTIVSIRKDDNGNKYVKLKDLIDFLKDESRKEGFTEREKHLLHLIIKELIKLKNL